MKLLVLVLTLFAVPALCAPSPGADKETAAAKAHYAEGVHAYREGHYREAIQDFQAAYSAKPSGLLFFNIAQCYEKLGDLPNALRSYRDYLREVPKAPDRKTVLAAMHSIELRLAERGVQQLLVRSVPAGAQVQIDATPRGVTPLEVELAPGAHHLTLALSGYVTHERDFTVEPDRSMQLDLTLELAPRPDATAIAERPLSPPPLPPPADSGSAAEPPVHSLPPAATTVQTQRGTTPWFKSRALELGLLGTGGVALAGAIGFGIAAQKASHDLRALPGTQSQAEANALAGRAVADSRASNALYAAAGVLAAGGVTVFVLRGSF